MFDLIPLPASITAAGAAFTLTAVSAVYVDAEEPQLERIGEYLANQLRLATGFPLPVFCTHDEPGAGHISLTVAGGDDLAGDEGYMLTVDRERVTIAGAMPEGVFRGVQTLRQLFSPVVEECRPQTGPWHVPAVVIRDAPRFGWRGAMLDVARHFFSVNDVKRTIDLLAYYKFNRLHLHLADDQGWRIEIKSWPNLALYGGSTEVGGGEGGYYTQAEYADLVAYAGERYIVIVPEIDMPGHTNAALAAYPELNCNDVAPDLYTGIEVGFSSLCVDKEITYQFIDDVVRELAYLTPGRWIHIGGDEAASTPHEDYLRFVERVQNIVRSHAKEVVGWEEIGQVNLLPATLAQLWNTGSEHSAESILKATAQGAQIIMSPANRTYLDMKYDPDTTLGLQWAGAFEVQDSYVWDPASVVLGLSESVIAGVEAPIWSETLTTIAEIEYMAFPRLLSIAEIGWSPATGRSWDEYRLRLAAHSARFSAMGVNYYRSPQVQWQ